MKKRVTLFNIILSLLLQIVSVISGLIIPRLILSAFGSNANGLVTSINQLLNYIVLIEGGVTGVISANLYKPLVEQDWEKVSSVLVTARSFYRKIGLIFVGYTLVLAVVYPHIVDTGYDSLYVFALTCVLSIGLLLQYMFSITMTTLLNADKKVYVVSSLSILLTIGNIGLVILVVTSFPDMILLKAASAVLFALQPLVFGLYIRKHYPINWHAPKNNDLIKQRWNGFAINFAFFIHTSTDVTILTLMSTLSTVSVYSVYYLVVSKISVLIHSIAAGIEPTIGQTYAKNDEAELHQKMDLYECVVFFSVGLLFTLTGLLITPFVQLYTEGITDADYFQPLFGVLLVLSEAVYMIRYPHVTLSYAANKFKDVTVPAYIEAVINIVVSVALIKPLGLVGIAIGTGAGMLYRMMFHVSFTQKIFPGRGPQIFYRKLLIMALATAAGIVLCTAVLPLKEISIASWLLHAVAYAAVIGVIYGITAVLFFKKEIGYIKQYLFSKNRQ